ncbi:hypothetical protein Tco_1050314 [Tanacetum coccineum]
MEASRLASLHELSLLGTQLVVVVVIDKSSRNTSVISRATGISLILACRRTHCKHTTEDDLEVFSTDDLGLDWISVHNFLTRLQKLSSYASGHLEVSELAACLEKASFSNTSGDDEVF